MPPLPCQQLAAASPEPPRRRAFPVEHLTTERGRRTRERLDSSSSRRDASDPLFIDRTARAEKATPLKASSGIPEIREDGERYLLPQFGATEERLLRQLRMLQRDAREVSVF